MMDLACCSQDELVSIKTIAERQGIPDSYLEQLFSTLRKAGIIQSVKGPYGGYKLAALPENITVASIIRTLDGEMTVLSDKEHVTFQEDPMAYYLNTALWEKLDEKVQVFLTEITLEEMKKGYAKLMDTEAYMYYI